MDSVIHRYSPKAFLFGGKNAKLETSQGIGPFDFLYRRYSSRLDRTTATNHNF